MENEILGARIVKNCDCINIRQTNCYNFYHSLKNVRNDLGDGWHDERSSILLSFSLKIKTHQIIRL